MVNTSDWWGMVISIDGGWPWWPSPFWENISIRDIGGAVCLYRGFSLKPCGWGPKSSLTFWGDVFQITLVPLSLSWSSSIFVYRILCRSDINGLSWPSKQLPISADPSLIFSSTHLKILTCRYWDLLKQSPYVFLRIIHALSGILPPLLIQAITAARAGNEKLLQRNRYETLRYLQKRATSQSARSVSNWKNARTIENRWFSTALMLLGHGTATPVPWGWLMLAAWNHMNSILQNILNTARRAALGTHSLCWGQGTSQPSHEVLANTGWRMESWVESSVIVVTTARTPKDDFEIKGMIQDGIQLEATWKKQHSSATNWRVFSILWVKHGRTKPSIIPRISSEIKYCAETQ